MHTKSSGENCAQASPGSIASLEPQAVQQPRAAALPGASLLLAKELPRPSSPLGHTTQLCSSQHPHRERQRPKGKLIKQPLPPPTHNIPYSSTKWDLRVYFACPDGYRLSIIRTLCLQERSIPVSFVLVISCCITNPQSHVTQSNNQYIIFHHSAG